MSNKSIYIIRLIVLLVVLALLILIAVNMFKSSQSFFGFWETSGKKVYSEQFQDINTIKSDLSSGALKIVEWDGADTKVIIYQKGFGSLDVPQVSINGSTLCIEQRNTVIGSMFSMPVIEVFVPRESRYDYQLHSLSGSLLLDALSGKCQIKNTSGSVKIMQNGDTLDLDAASGSVKVYGSFVNATISCISGSIKACANQNSESLNITCTSGSIKVQFNPKDLGYSAVLISNSGSVKNTYTNAGIKGEGVWGNGDGKLKMSITSTSGSIKLCDWAND